MVSGIALPCMQCSIDGIYILNLDRQDHINRPCHNSHHRYSSRLSYAHTTAVMSMVGYVLGLGDRHGENILFDSKSGDCVHVDFNCLFNRVHDPRITIVIFCFTLPESLKDRHNCIFLVTNTT